MCITAGSPAWAQRVRVIRAPTHLFPDAVRDQRMFFAQSHFLFSTETSMSKRLRGESERVNGAERLLVCRKAATA